MPLGIRFKLANIIARGRALENAVFKRHAISTLRPLYCPRSMKTGIIAKP